jgi:hypothetical protein
MANRLQPTTASGVSSLFLIDPERVAPSFLSRYQMIDLATTGLSKKGELFVDYTLKVYAEEAHGVIRAIDETAAVVA